MVRPASDESFEEFCLSFSYGGRNDLNFKFFKSLPDDQVAHFLQQLLHELGDAYDTGEVLPMMRSAIDAQIAGYAPDPDAGSSSSQFDDGPFAPVEVPMANARVGLLTTSGHFVRGDDPEPFGEPELTQADAVHRISDFLKDTPVLSSIPADTPIGDLRVRHGGYDIRSSLKDPNVTFPIECLREARADGRVGSLSQTFYSFPGATAQGRLRRELPGWVDRISEDEIDVLLLVPV